MGKRKTASSQPEDPSSASDLPPAPQDQNSPSNTIAPNDSPVPEKQQSESSKRPNLSNGSWRGKATAVAEIARESITAAASSARESAQSKAQPATTPNTPNKKSSNLLTPTRPKPCVASVSKVTATSGVPETDATQETETKDGPTEKGPATTDPPSQEQMQERPLPVAGWRGWWAKGQDEKVAGAGTADSNTADSQTKANDNSQPTAGKPLDPTFFTPNKLPPNSNAEEADLDGSKATPRSSWFGLWGSSNGPPGGESDAASTSRKSVSLEPSQSNDAAAAEPTIAPPKRVSTESTGPGNRPASGSWAFWSRDAGGNSTTIGELAVADTTSAADPQTTKLADPAKQNDAKPSSSKGGPANEGASTPDPKKATKAVGKAAPSPTPASSRPSSLAPANSESQPTEKTQDKTPATKAMPQNLLLPAFHKTYSLAQTPSYWQQLTRMFGRHANHPSEQRHLSLSTNPPRLKSALAIGVHGYFPSPLLQKVLGPPTGTSIRFAKSAAAAVKKWADAHQPDSPIDIEMVALEGEGMVGARLDTLWKLLLNWLEQLRRADFILVACHSQGVPVACLLVQRLLEFGVLAPHTRIGICAMAGVNLGPFASYRSRFLDASASELFQFSLPGSSVSTRYAAALDVLLAHHVRITYIGSIDDQLVSLESSTFATCAHPYIFRAVFVDGRIHAPDFLTHLVGFALKLRNLGISDHGLVRELSAPLAGSLYGGEGHSRIYQEAGVYDLAVAFALETTSLTAPGGVAVERIDYEVPAAQPNPYVLPWAMRGLLEEEFVKTELRGETAELLRQFESWRPTSKVLQDVKFRLEAVKSKL